MKIWKSIFLPQKNLGPFFFCKIKIGLQSYGLILGSGHKYENLEIDLFPPSNHCSYMLGAPGNHCADLKVIFKPGTGKKTNRTETAYFPNFE